VTRRLVSVTVVRGGGSGIGASSGIWRSSTTVSPLDGALGAEVSSRARVRETFITIRSLMRYKEMTESSEIQQLREDIQELRLLYRRLAETLLPEEEPTPEEKAALDDESKEYFSEGEFLRMLQSSVRRRSKRSASA